MATAELALVIPAVLLVLAMCLTGAGLAIDQIRCTDAARVAARAASRGEAPDLVRRAARAGAPEGAQVQVRREGDQVLVTVSAPARVSWLPGLPGASASAAAPVEPAVDQ